MGKIQYKHWILLLLCCQLSACGTIVSLTDGNYQAYAGVAKDFDLIRDGGVFSILAVVDLPLSFVLDTLMLPVTLSH